MRNKMKPMITKQPLQPSLAVSPQLKQIGAFAEIGAPQVVQ
jgi:hypothetical protein